MLEEIPKYKAVVEKFTTNVIISQAAFCDSVEKELRDGEEGSLATAVFSRDEVGEKRWTDLKARIVEHNIMMMAKYYTKIRLTRMAKLLALTEAETEMVNSLCCLCLFLIIIIQVVSGTVSAKTDRLEGIIDFTEQQVSDELDVAKIDEFLYDDIRPSDNPSHPYYLDLITVVILVAVAC